MLKKSLLANVVLNEFDWWISSQWEKIPTKVNYNPTVRKDGSLKYTNTYRALKTTKLKEVYQVKPNTPILNGNYKSYDEYGFLLVDRNYVNNIQNGKSTSYFGANELGILIKQCLSSVPKLLT